MQNQIKYYLLKTDGKNGRYNSLIITDIPQDPDLFMEIDKPSDEVIKGMSDFETTYELVDGELVNPQPINFEMPQSTESILMDVVTEIENILGELPPTLQTFKESMGE